LGSHAFRDVPRALFGFAKDESQGIRVMTQVKSSLGRDDLPSFTHKMEPCQLDTNFGPAETARFVFTGESYRSVADVLSDKRDDDDHTERDQVAECLADYLSEDPVTYTELRRVLIRAADHRNRRPLVYQMPLAAV
jgi:hypothetical protein